ncbi:MAG: hypothetical protein KC503_08570 [Myxococcales bacterium]|nr:hypothetical protein [Myxococcales bacterium]
MDFKAGFGVRWEEHITADNHSAGKKKAEGESILRLRAERLQTVKAAPPARSQRLGRPKQHLLSLRLRRLELRVGRIRLTAKSARLDGQAKRLRAFDARLWMRGVELGGKRIELDLGSTAFRVDDARVALSLR